MFAEECRANSIQQYDRTNMVSPRTNIFLSDETGRTVVNDFAEPTCLNCINSCSIKGMRTTLCSTDGKKRHVFFAQDEKGQLYVCDDKEKISKNFLTYIDLLKHFRPALIERYRNFNTGSCMT